MHFPKKYYIIGGIILACSLIVIPLIVIPLSGVLNQKQSTTNKQKQQKQQEITGLAPHNPIAIDLQIPQQGATPKADNNQENAKSTGASTPPASQYPQMYLTAASGATQYYVSPSGSDSNSGSQASPFATIQKAAQVVKPGSLVHVLPGVYTQIITINTSGTANARITFLSDTKWAAQIKTTGSKVPWTTDADYIDIIGFDITSDGARDGLVNYGSYTRTLANHIHDIPGICDTTGGSGMTDNGYTSHDNDIIGNVVNNIGSSYPELCQYVHAIYHSNARGHILNNIAFDNAGVGINLWHAATDTVVANNLVFNNKQHGISIGTNTDNTNGNDGDNFVVANNIIIYNALYGVRERIGVGSHDQFTNNIVYGNGKAAFGDENGNWPSASGSKDTNTITTDVRFKMYKADGTGDYHLQVGSPAINGGTTLGAPSYDYDGTPRQGGIDIGPFQP
ncbi:hypothetical protein KSF_060570 [Reticulibacter mediterranei]|uniref:Pel9A-like right handed beta-helix region domain-containing protein n=1 Tax=Reticulibacter mediterranei TaxID=2778369 RepID=A0A8J3N2C5_9CHLR|nr:choice-of-anchor Q domain-containing protein [Reticulibacter mediterranei]GHO96009.1 hypothetical protein KSF_060570 [Reticulibacter mediterranei]